MVKNWSALNKEKPARIFYFVGFYILILNYHNHSHGLMTKETSKANEKGMQKPMFLKEHKKH